MIRHGVATVALAAGLAGPLAAQGWVDIENRPGREPVGDVVRTLSDVRVTVNGRVALVEVRERFRNAGGQMAEGSYLYPLPRDAVFENFSLWVGDEETTGEMLPADQARGIYEEIVRRKKDPALLTLEGHGLIRARVFPIQPGETRQVVLRYRHVLPRTGDAMRLRYPLGVAGPTRGEGGEPDAGSGFTLLVPTDEVAAPYSPTHALSHRTRNGQLEVSVTGGAGNVVELFLPLRNAEVGTSVVTHAPGGEDGYFLMLLTPPPAEAVEALPRDLTLVVDVSGSMAGAKMEQARAALRQALATLGPRDRFRIIAFSSEVREFRDGFATATPGAVAEAGRFVSELQAAGGTNLEGAVRSALSARSEANRMSLIFLATDGLPSIGERNPERIAEMAAGELGNSRIFPVGIGHDVNTYLLDRLARDGRGSAEYVAPGADVEVAMGSLVQKLRFPAITNLRLVSSPARLDRLYPGELPDLFAGEELVLLGRYRDEARGPIIIEGTRNGRTVRIRGNATFPARSTDNAFIGRLWASRRIGELSRQVRLEGPDKELIEEIRTLALRYGIISEYTSYLVLEPEAQVRRQAAAPAAQSGEAAFRRAEESSALAKSTSLAMADQAVAANAPGERDGRGRADAVKRVGGRQFARLGETWTDQAHKPGTEIIRVQPFSEAWFELVRALPEIVPALEAGDRVVVAGRRVSIEVTPEGRSRWEAGALARVVRNFRGQCPLT